MFTYKYEYLLYSLLNSHLHALNNAVVFLWIGKLFIDIFKHHNNLKESYLISLHIKSVWNRRLSLMQPSS